MKSRLIWIIALALLLCCALGTGQAETGAADGCQVQVEWVCDEGCLQLSI